VQRDASDARTPTRGFASIVLLSDQAWSGKRIARLGCTASTVSRTLLALELYGQAGLIDRREDNGQCKAMTYTR